MKEIFNQIHSYTEHTFEDGKPFELTLSRKQIETSNDDFICQLVQKMEAGKSYKITVKKYMTEPSTSTFDFQDKWNNGVPMPLCIMTGKVIKETRGMYYMELAGKAEPMTRCMCCDKTLSNPVSKLYGIGPECGEKVGIIRIESEEEAKEKWNRLVKEIENIKWSGWVIKSAIKEFEEIL